MGRSVSHTWLSLSLACGLAVVGAPACTPDEGAEAAGAREAIVGRAAVADFGDPPRFPAVVAQFTPATGRAGWCSATLITPSHVLVAAHCVADWVERAGALQVFPGPQAYSVTMLIEEPDGGCDHDIGISTRTGALNVLDCAMHPCYRHPEDPRCWAFEETQPEQVQCGTSVGRPPSDIRARIHVDVAVLQLRGFVAPTWATGFTGPRIDPHRLLEPSESAPVPGDRVTLVGFGGTSADDCDVLGIRDLGARRFLADVPIDSITGTALLTNVAAGGTAKGDSGGPAIFEAAGGMGYRRAPVVGVASAKSEGAPGNLFAGLVYADPENDREPVEGVRSRLDRDGNGRWDVAWPWVRCSPSPTRRCATRC